MLSLSIVVVDDSALFRTMMRNVLTEIPGCEVIASVGDGKMALEKITELQPDLVTLDVEMPELNGIDVLRELKKRRLRTKVVMVSRLTTTGAQVTTDALLEGAFDFILKPSGKNPAENKQVLHDALQQRIAVLLGDADKSSSGLDSTSTATASPTIRKPIEAVVIGCSTGGPDALAHVIPDLNGDFPVPVFVVQHMPDGFTNSLAKRLNEASSLEVVEATDERRPQAGQVVMAHGGHHLQLQRRASGSLSLLLTEDPHEHGCRPAVDNTLRSAVKVFGGNLLVVILTGMGKDGTEGCRLAREHGATIVAQHAKGCTVYGMPKSVINAGLADHVIKLPEMASGIERLVKMNRSLSFK